jgi:hypothetical protein
VFRFSGRIKVRGPGDTRVAVVAKPRGDAVGIPLFFLGGLLIWGWSGRNSYGSIPWVSSAFVALSLVVQLVLAVDVKLVRAALERILNE